MLGLDAIIGGTVQESLILEGLGQLARLHVLHAHVDDSVHRHKSLHVTSHI